jgi:hypothetical protein
MTTYVLSIEPTEGTAFRHGFHLGSDLAVAKTLAAEMFVARNAASEWTRTVAIFEAGPRGAMVDVFDGRWASEYHYADDEEAA